MNVLLRLTVMCMCCAVLFAQPPVNNNEAALDKRYVASFVRTSRSPNREPSSPSISGERFVIR
jgi:hypothetical protein